MKYQCPECLERFTYVMNFESHIRKKHIWLVEEMKRIVSKHKRVKEASLK